MPGDLRVKFSIADIPEWQARLRRDLAQLLRDAAAGEPQVVVDFANRVAALFETGLREDEH